MNHSSQSLPALTILNTDLFLQFHTDIKYYLTLVIKIKNRLEALASTAARKVDGSYDDKRRGPKKIAEDKRGR